jgi:DNA-binding response OmpR family regulator
MEQRKPRGGPSIVLLMSGDRKLRDALRRAVAVHQLQLVHASAGLAGLELLQRFSETFRLAAVDTDIPGLPGSVVMETLRQFRPELPVVCLSSGRALAGAMASRCLGRPIDEDLLAEAVESALRGASPLAEAWTPLVGPRTIARAHECFRVSGDLVEAALELARGMPVEPEEDGPG